MEAGSTAPAAPSAPAQPQAPAQGAQAGKQSSPLSTGKTDTQAQPKPQGASAKPADVPATPAEKRMMKLKVDGGEQDYDEDTVKRWAQKGMYADKQIEANTKATKALEQFYATVKSNPQAAIKELAKQTGFSVDQVATALLSEHLDGLEKTREEKAMSPEQRAQRERDAKLERYEAEERERNAAAETKEYNTRREAARQKHVDTIGQALDSLGYLKGEGEMAEAVRDRAVGHAAEYMLYCHQNKIPFEPADVAEHVMRMDQEMFSMLLGVADDQTFGKFLPEAFVKRVGKYYAQQLRSGSAKASSPKAPVERAAPQPARANPNGLIKYSELQRQRQSGK